MTHFLSAVTQNRLEFRKIDSQRTDDVTLQCLPDVIPGKFRCAAPSVWRAGADRFAAADDIPCVWCGEHDGSISVRSTIHGTILATIPRKQCKSGISDATAGPHVFVFCMCSPRHDQMWAGMSDGSLRIFDTLSLELLYTFHAHSAIVTALCVAAMPTSDEEFEHHMNVVISASSDWTLAKWDTTTFQCLGKFNGHHISVRCLSASNSGEFLVSGADDGSLRMWSLLHVEEVRSLPGEDGMTVTFWPVQGHATTVSSVLIVNDAFVVSTGFDGRAVVWSLGGELLTELEHRACGLTCVVHDAVCGRILVGGIDGTIKVFSDNGREHQWACLGTLLDHSGAYVSAMVPVRHDVLQRLWILDGDGIATNVEEHLDLSDGGGASVHDEIPPQSTEGPIDEAEVRLMMTADAMRQDIVRSYAELREHRQKIANAEAYQRFQREKIVLKLGDRVREGQYAVYRVERWLLRARFTQLTNLRAEWLERCSHRTFASICFWRWLIIARERSRIVTKARYSDVVRSMTTGLWKTQTAKHLELQLYEQRTQHKIRPLVEACSVRGENIIRGRYFHVWRMCLVSSRKSTTRTHLAGSRNRLHALTKQIIDERCERKRTMTAEHLAKLGRVLSIGIGGLQSLHVSGHYFHLWHSFQKVRKFDRTQRVEREAAQQAVDARHAAHMCFRHWQQRAQQRLLTRASEEAPQLQQELAMWEELIRDASTLSSDTLAAQLRTEKDKAMARSDMLKELKDEAMSVLDTIHEIKSDLVASGLRLQPGLDVDSRVDAIFNYMKARGINTFRDVATITAAREEYFPMPLFVAAPPVAPLPSSPLRRPAPLSTRTASPAARRASAPAAGGAKSASSKPVAKASSPKKAAPRPKCLITEFEAVYKKLAELVRSAAVHAGQRADATVPTSLQYLAGLTQHDASLLDDEDWCVAPDAIQHFKRKDVRECAAMLRRLICLHDCIRVKQDDAANSSLTALRSHGAGGSPAPPMVPSHILRQVLCNAPTILKLATHDFSLSSLEYVDGDATAEMSDAVVSSPLTAARRSTSPQAHTVPLAEDSSRQAAAQPSVVPRRHSSPAASQRARPAAPAPIALKTRVAPSAKPSKPLPKAASESVVRDASPEPDSSETVPVASPSPRPTPKAASKPFIGLRVAVGPPLNEKSRAPSLMIAECNEWYPSPTEADSAATLAGPAYAAGLRVGDLLYRFAGYAVTDLAAFNAIIARHAKSGAVIPVQVIDPGTKEVKTFTIVVGSR